ncbi:MAG TPA: NADP-dependent oxidoreductase [Steroidobacteraceae bacterium]|nr:NADP-dependent oxidoreductase [Steroidobacteraceae bacterium]
MTPRADRNRFWRLIRHPQGNAFASAFALESGAIPTPAANEVLIANDYLSLDAGTRLWMSPRTDTYQPPLPLGSEMRGLVLGRIIQSQLPAYPAGKLVRAFGSWADYSCVDPLLSGLFVLDESVSDVRQHLGALGMNGWTAYAGITEVGRTRPGETVLVSAAAGATGMLAAQIARVMGCRVIGLTGGERKCAFLREQLGLDAAVDYKSPRLAQQLDAFAGAIDVYFDNVGGPLLDEILPRMAHYGRIVVSGLMAAYASDRPMAPRRFDQVLMRRLTISGLFSPDFMSRGPAMTQILRRWLDAGQLRMPLDVTDGLEQVLAAYGKLFEGGNIGKVLVRLGA